MKEPNVSGPAPAADRSFSLDARFILRPEEAAGLLFFVLLSAMSIAHRAPLFEPVRNSRLTFATAIILMLLLAGSLAWTLGRALTQRRSGRVIDRKGLLKRSWQIVRDWLPAVMCLGIYESLKHLHLNDIIFWLGIAPKDHLMIRADELLFGFHASVALQAIISDAMTLYMKAVYYYGYYLYPAIVGVFFYLWRPRVAFRELALAFISCAFIGYMFYILVPVAGPRFTEVQYMYTVPLTASTKMEILQMDTLRYQYDCFPSLHTAMPLTVLIVAFRHSRRLGAVLAPFVLSTVVSTLYLRMHYLIDVVAGVALAPVCVWIGVRGDRWWWALHRLAGRGRDEEAQPRRHRMWVHLGLAAVAAVWLFFLVW